MTEIKRKNKTLKLYACGGAGTNVGLLFEPQRNVKDSSFADISISYLDTSDSNFEMGEQSDPAFQAVPADSIYIIPKAEGSGAYRKENSEEIASRIKEILQLHKPGDFNIVISSLGGGTGSVIAPNLVRELLTRDIPVLVIGIGNTSNKTWAKNTSDTLKSYELIAKRREAGIVMAYFDNDTGRKKTDGQIYELITSLSVLFSGRNRELDAKDLVNFLRFDRVPVCQFEPMLMALTTVERGGSIPDLGNIATVATLAVDPDDSVFTYMGNGVDYQTIGYLTTDAPANIHDITPFHFVVSDGPIVQAFETIQDKLGEMDEVSRARVKRTSLLSGDEHASDDDIVF